MMQIKCIQKGFVKTLIKQLRKYHNLWLKSDALVLADVFESFRKMCLESYQSDATIFFLSSRISISSSFKKDWSKMILTDIDMLLMIKRVSKKQYVTLLIDIQQLIINIWKNMIKKKGSPYLKYLDVNSLYGWEMSQKLPVNGFQ